MRMSFRIFIFCLDRGGQHLHQLQRHLLYIFFTFIEFFLLLVFDDITDDMNCIDYIHKQQDQNSDTDKYARNRYFVIYRNCFKNHRKHCNKQSKEQQAITSTPMIPISDQESNNDSKKSNNKDCVCCWHCLNIICNTCKMQDRTDDKIQ